MEGLARFSDSDTERNSDQDEDIKTICKDCSARFSETNDENNTDSDDVNNCSYLSSEELAT